MRNKLQIAFPATAAFHSAAAKAFAADPVGTAAIFEASHAASLAKSLQTDGSFEHFMFALTDQGERRSLAEWLPSDGFLEEERADACLVSTDGWRRPSDVCIKAACHRIGVPGVGPETLVADLANLNDIVAVYVPAPAHGMRA